MREAGLWQETKFERNARGGWQASRTNVPITSRLVTDLIAESYAQAIAQHASGRLADLGCGKVPLYGMYRSRVSEVVCVDWPGSAHGGEHVDLFADLNHPLELDAESFDTILATDVIEHLHSPQALFASAARALVPGGKLIAGVPFLYWVHEAPNDFHRYTRFALERLALEAGLEVVSLSPYAGAPEVIADVATKALGGRPRLAHCMHTVTRAFLALPAVKRLSAATRDKLPMGYVLVACKP